MTTGKKLELETMYLTPWDVLLQANRKTIKTYCRPRLWPMVHIVHDVLLSLLKKYGDDFTGASAYDVATLAVGGQEPTKEMVEEVEEAICVLSEVLVKAPNGKEKKFVLLPRWTKDKDAIPLMPIGYAEMPTKPPVTINAAGNYVYDGKEYTEKEFFAKIQAVVDMIPGIEKVPGTDATYRFTPDFDPNWRFPK